MLFAGIPILIAGAFILNNKKSTDCAGSCQQKISASSMSADTLRKDPICGMKADDAKSDTVHYKGTVYAFCSKGCKEEFVKNPESHLPKSTQH